jgi:hypothetical protein
VGAGSAIGCGDNEQRLGTQAEDINALVGILALAVIPTIIAAATIVYAQVLFRLARRAGPVVK